MRNMHTTLLDLQEIAYEIQIRNFNRTRDIIKDNSSDTELYALLCITLSFTLITFFVETHYSIKRDLA